MGFNFTPSVPTKAGQSSQQAPVILLGGIEVGVHPSSSLIVAMRIENPRVLSAPVFDATLLLMVRCPCKIGSGDDSWLEVVSKGNHEVGSTPRRAAGNSLPNVCRKPSHSSGDLQRQSQPFGRTGRYSWGLVARFPIEALAGFRSTG